METSRMKESRRNEMEVGLSNSALIEFWIYGILKQPLYSLFRSDFPTRFLIHECLIIKIGLHFFETGRDFEHTSQFNQYILFKHNSVGETTRVNGGQTSRALRYCPFSKQATRKQNVSCNRFRNGFACLLPESQKKTL